MTITRVPLAELSIEDEPSFRHVALYGDLKAIMRQPGVSFGVLEAPAALPGDARLLNLAFWQPGDVAEVLSEPVIAADQVMHNAWHVLASQMLGSAGGSAMGLLLAEAIASAFDIYLVGRLLGHAPDSLFLQSQVPAMRDAADDALLDDDAFEALFSRAAEQPEQCFRELRELLFDAARGLYQAADLDAAHAALQQFAGHPWFGLLHHYELITWVLYARCYGTDASATEALATDTALRSSDCELSWLSEQWVAKSLAGASAG